MTSTDIVERLRAGLPDIQTKAMAGDRLVDIVAEAFDLPGSVFDMDADTREVMDAIHHHYASHIESQNKLIEEMTEALEFYADVSKYPAPLTGGMGALWEDCGGVARRALSYKDER